MPTYRVKATGTVTEYYLVEADSEEQAMRDWRAWYEAGLKPPQIAIRQELRR